MSRIYFYKMTTDDGGAPCVQDGLLSLAICKPMIRMRAQRRDLIFGFAANSLDPDNRLIYIAHVSSNLGHGMYYVEQEFANRRDCIYQRRNCRFETREDAHYHTDKEHLEHDLGTFPTYEKATTLLSDDFRYFGCDGSFEYKTKYPLIRSAVEALRRGYRVNLPEGLHNQLRELEQEVWGKSQHKTMGMQSGDPRRSVCHRNRSCGVVGDEAKRAVSD